jgi:hypothetical protein
MTTYTDRQKACIAALQEALYEGHELWINGPQAIAILEHIESTSPVSEVGLTDEHRALIENAIKALDQGVEAGSEHANDLRHMLRDISASERNLSDRRILLIASQTLDADTAPPAREVVKFARALFAAQRAQTAGCDGSGAVAVSVDDWTVCPACEGAGCTRADDGDCKRCGCAWSDCRCGTSPTIEWSEYLCTAPAEVDATDWMELTRRLYVELHTCDQQMRSTRDESDEPHWTQSTVVRDVLADAKKALESTSPIAGKPDGGAGDVRGEPVAWRYLTPTGWHATTKLDKALGASAHHDMEPLYAAPSQRELDARTELEVKAGLWDEVRTICVPHGAGVDKTITEWLAERLAAPSQPAAPAVHAQKECAHRVVDARNQVVQSGYMCVDCGALFAAADHGERSANAAPSTAAQGATLKWRDSYEAEHKRVERLEAILVREFGLKKARALIAAPTPVADSGASVDTFRNAVEEMVVLLENGEWAEHVAEAIAGGDELASRLETAITELHNDIGEVRDSYAAAKPVSVDAGGMTDQALIEAFAPYRNFPVDWIVSYAREVLKLAARASMPSREAVPFDTWWRVGGWRIVSEAGDKQGWYGAAEAGYIGGLFADGVSIAPQSTGEPK